MQKELQDQKIFNQALSQKINILEQNENKKKENFGLVHRRANSDAVQSMKGVSLAEISKNINKFPNDIKKVTVSLVNNCQEEDYLNKRFQYLKMRQHSKNCISQGGQGITFGSDGKLIKPSKSNSHHSQNSSNQFSSDQNYVLKQNTIIQTNVDFHKKLSGNILNYEDGVTGNNGSFVEGNSLILKESEAKKTLKIIEESNSDSEVKTAKTFEPINIASIHLDAVRDLCLVNNNKLLLSASEDSLIHIWNINSLLTKPECSPLYTIRCML